MEVTLNGPTGLDVAGHAQEGLSSAFVRAPIPRLQMVEQTVGDWDQGQNQGSVSYVGAQVNILLSTLKKQTNKQQQQLTFSLKE